MSPVHKEAGVSGDTLDMKIFAKELIISVKLFIFATSFIINTSMERIKSSDLRGANAYFTNFDTRIVAFASNVGVLEREIERVLKILLLTKNNVVCAASHLINPLSYKLISKNPILLDKELIIPAFRADKTDFTELFEGKNIPEDDRNLYTSFYSVHLSKTVLWEVQENSNWFRNAFIQGLSAPNSVIRKNLSHLSETRVNKLIDKIKEKDTLDRDTIERLSSNYDKNSKSVIRNYRDLLYHMGGARAVNCESTLPQENYIDYSFTDLEERKTQLSEIQVFWKIFLELLLETLNRYKFPVEALDVITFDDIYHLRQPILESNFIENYNRLFQIAVNSISKDNRNDILYNASELMEIKLSLEKQYKEIFEKQLPQFFARKALNNGKELLKNTANMGLGFVPFSNIINGILGILGEFKSTYFNILQTFQNIKSINDYEHYTRAKTQLLQKKLSKFEIGRGTEMIDIVDMIQYTLSSKGTL